MRQKSNGTHLILMELMMVLFFFAICGSILLQVFVKAHNISAKAREMTETKNYVTQAAELIEAGAYDIKDFQEYFTQIDGKAGDYQCYYDQDWNEIKKTKARYHMTIKLERQPAKVLGKITMWRENQQIYQLDILRYRQERKDSKMPFLGIGAASIVLVLAMVCLAVFAALTLSSAKGDHTLSKKNLERTSAFYQASNAANEQVGAIDEKLWKLYRKSKDKKDYMKRVGRSFTKSKGISYNKKEKTIAFQESITDTQQLSVKLQIYYPEKKNDLCYEVIKWKKEAVGEWKKEDFLPVYRNK